MQFNSQRFQEIKTNKEEEPRMEQFFGEGNVFDLEETSGGNRQYRVPKKEASPLDRLAILDKVPLKGRAGFMMLFILHVLIFPILLMTSSFGDFGLSLLSAIAIVVLWKQIRFEEVEHLDHYVGNLVITGKALLMQGKWSKKLFRYSMHLMFAGVGLLIINVLLMGIFFSGSWKDAFELMAIFLFSIGLVFSLSKREWALGEQITIAMAFILLIDILLSAIRGDYSVLSVSFFILLWFACSHIHLWRKALEGKAERGVE